MPGHATADFKVIVEVLDEARKIGITSRAAPQPGSRNGQKVQCKVRLPIRFSAAG